MSFWKKTIRDWDIAGKTVLLRADYNVPITPQLTIADDYRIKKSLPTIRYLIQQNCKVIICSHLGRPTGVDDAKCSLAPVATRLSELLGQGVIFAADCVGPDVAKKAKELEGGGVMLLQNVRYHPEEEQNDDDFAQAIIRDTGVEIFVQDGFGVVHRAHASTDAIARHLPALAGFLLEQEVDIITGVMDNPERPLMAVVGGAKISDKIEVLNRLIDIADVVAVGGAMANTFLLAKGFSVGKSLVEPDSVDMAKQIIARAEEKSKNSKFVFYLPQDGVVATAIDKAAKTRIVDWGSHVIADVTHYPGAVPPQSSLIEDNEMILDVGPFSASFIVGCMQLAHTVIWNGALGVTETTSVQGPIGPTAHATELVVEGLLGQFGQKPFSVIGGGDTVGYIENRKMTDMFNHVSTGGGASLDLMSGKNLPGVDVLWNKD